MGIVFSYFALILIFFSVTGLGNYLNQKYFKVKIHNFYENFIIGISFVIFYLQIHIIFLPINFINSLTFILLGGDEK